MQVKEYVRFNVLRENNYDCLFSVQFAQFSAALPFSDLLSVSRNSYVFGVTPLHETAQDGNVTNLYY